jgi:GntR family transcriptional regulator
MTAPPEVAAILDLDDGAEVVARRRIIHRQGQDDDPVEVSTSYFRTDLAAGTAIEQMPNIREGMLAYVENLTGRRYTTAVDQVSARRATDEEAALLRLGEDRCVLVISHATYDADGQPLEVVQSLHPAGGWTLEDEYPLDR